MKRRVIALAFGALLLGGATTAPIVDAGYQPQDKDERGLWMQMDEEERRLKNSNFVIRDAALNAYVRDVFCRTVGEAECRPIRIYLVRTAYFNASMAPNGMMQVWTGLFLRTRNEAQLSAVMGHEFTHYKNRHSLQLFRQVREKAGVAAFLGGFGLLGSMISLGMISGVFQFSRDMEREADMESITLMSKSGYDPHAAGLIWEQMRAEMDASAAARNVATRKDRNGGMFATHPPTAERMTYLKELAEKIHADGTPVVREAEYRAALGPFWAMFIDDQIKLNDFGSTDFLLQSLASKGWTAELLYARGELYRTRGLPDDLKQAVGFYRDSLSKDPSFADGWRGLGLTLIRSGAQPEGKAALKTYLEKRPEASDRAMMLMLAGG